MARLFAIQLDASQVDALAEQVAKLDPESLSKVIVTTLNDVAEETYKLSRQHIQKNINIRESYIDRTMSVEKATAGRPTASIVASAVDTNISHYGAMQLAKDVTWSNERILGMGKKFGKWPGWTRRKGNLALGIDEGEKVDGVQVEVTRGAKKRMGPTFMLPGKKDRDGVGLVFRRTEAGTIQSVLGPGVYQLFRRTAEAVYDDVSENLAAEIVKAAENEIAKNL